LSEVPAMRAHGIRAVTSSGSLWLAPPRRSQGID
jgi:hypothetical protein